MAGDNPHVPRSLTRAEDCSDCASRGSCLLGDLPPDELLAMQPHVERRGFAPGELLTPEGQRASHVSIVKVGNVFGYRRGIDGKNRPIGIAGRGSAFGLFGYFGQPNQVSTLGVSFGRVCLIANSVLRRAAAGNAAFANELVATAVLVCGNIAAWSEAMRLRGLVNQLAYSVVLLSDAQRSAVIELPTHTALGELLGATRESIARALGVLERESGIRRLERKKCEVYRKALLSRILNS